MHVALELLSTASWAACNAVGVSALAAQLVIAGIPVVYACRDVASSWLDRGMGCARSPLSLQTL